VSLLRKGVRTIPDSETLKGIENLQNPPKRKRGRPKGSKNKPGVTKAAISLVDPKTGVVVSNNAAQSQIIARMGDERVTAFVQYHMDMLQMRQGVDKKNVPDLYQRFYRYLAYCAEKGIIPNNMNAYFAIGITKQEISAWNAGQRSPEHKQFAEDIKQFFASIHEQAGGEGIVNPILSIYWSKAHDNLSDQPKIEVSIEDPLGQRASSEEIARRYSDILPTDN